MQAIDEVAAAVAVHRAAIRAKAKDPLTIWKLVDLKRCVQDPSGDIVNAADLVSAVKAKYPDEFEQPVILKPPETPKPDTRDAFEMTDSEFENAWRSRFPWTK
jgi:hypothetical protein